jgi:protein-S-isoprenylcysteine O-methyltransferase Ste14
MTPSFLVFGGLHLTGLLARDAYELLKKAGRLDTEDARVFVAVFAAMVALWVGWFGMAVTDPKRLAVPAALLRTGLGLVGAGIAVAVGGVVQLRGLENIDHLVTTGLYSRIRHPMYCGFILWILGWGISQGALASLAVGLLDLVSILWWRHLEDGDLESRYGKAYSEYRTTTWF